MPIVMTCPIRLNTPNSDGKARSREDERQASEAKRERRRAQVSERRDGETSRKSKSGRGKEREEADGEDRKGNQIEMDLVMVKMGYLEPDLYAMQADWMMALTPGGVDQNLEGLTYKRIRRPMFPFDKNMAEPDLTAKLVQ